MGALAHPADPWPNYTRFNFTYTDDGMRVAVDGLFFEMDVAVECRGTSSGLFEPDDVTVTDVFGNQQSFPYVGARERGSVGLRAGVLNAIDREWQAIETWLVEKAEEER